MPDVFGVLRCVKSSLEINEHIHHGNDAAEIDFITPPRIPLFVNIDHFDAFPRYEIIVRDRKSPPSLSPQLISVLYAAQHNAYSELGDHCT